MIGVANGNGYDVYVPRQANLGIVDHAVRKLGIPPSGWS